MLHSCDEAEVQRLLLSSHELHKIWDTHGQHVLIHDVTAGRPTDTHANVKYMVQVHMSIIDLPSGRLLCVDCLPYHYSMVHKLIVERPTKCKHMHEHMVHICEERQTNRHVEQNTNLPPFQSNYSRSAELHATMLVLMGF